MPTVRVVKMDGTVVYWQARKSAILEDILSSVVGVMSFSHVRDVPPHCNVSLNDPYPGVTEYTPAVVHESHNARHQRSYRRRQEASGKREIRVWVDECNVETVRDFARKL